MKRIVTLLLAFIAITSAYAEVVTADQALVAAREFISKGQARFTAGPGIALMLAHEARSLDGKPDYYVFNNGVDGGYIVVTGDDRTVPVWGYSTSGTFDYESLPENAKWWLSEYQRQLQFLRDHPEAKARQVETLSKSVDSLLTTKWDQCAPYNYYCPAAQNNSSLMNKYVNNACTGCVATALAQIMYHHKWPATGTGSKNYDCYVEEYQENGSGLESGFVERDRLEKLNADFSKSAYKWNLMKNEYKTTIVDGNTYECYYKAEDGDWVEINFSSSISPGLAVAKLMSDVGIAVEMTYGAPGRGGSGAYCSKARTAMETFFQYSAELKKRDDEESEYIVDGEWDNKIRDEIDADRPVFYGGERKVIEDGEEKTYAHAFVFDGYDNEGRFHVNWGWGGKDNNYYLSNLLNPDTKNYNTNHKAIFLTPERDRKSLSVAMPKGNAGKVLKGGVKANLPFTVFGNNLDREVTFTLSGSDADQFFLTRSSVSAAEANSGINCILSYLPTRVGAHTAQLTVSSGNDVDPVILELTGHAVLYYDADGDATVSVHDLTASIDALLTDGNVAYTDRSISIDEVTGMIDYLLSGNQEMDVEDGLVAYYPFDEDAHDASGNGNDGVLCNVTPTTGTYGEANGAYEFGGYYNPGYIRIPNSESLQFTDGFSFSCFVKPTDWFGQDTVGNFTTTDAVQAIFAKSNDHNGPAFQFAGTPSRIKFYCSSLEQSSQWCGINSLDRIQGDKLNNWIHVALTYSNKEARMYIDGLLIKSKNITPNFSQMNSHDLYLGQYSNDWYPLNGVLDEVRIYNRALTDIEVLALSEGSEQAYAETHPFKLSQRSVSLSVGANVTIEILNGNGSYSVGGDTDIVDFTLNQENESITLTGVAEGTTNVTVIDINTQTTISLPVTVTAPVDTHEWVDLGLPSGTLWATCNVGASTPEDYGDYFAWGETAPKDLYDWSTYKWCNGSEGKLTKYCTNSSYGYNGFVDNKTELDPEDDAAYVNWGPSWRMPTHDQFLELIDNCTWQWTQRNGVYGQLVSGPNGNTLFLPTAGYRWYDSLYGEGSYGCCWSRTLYSLGPSDAYDLYVNSGYWNEDSNGYRGCGLTVRAVRIP